MRDVGKRSAGKFERNPRDFYETPRAAVEPLIPHLPARTVYHEPCAGGGALVGHLGALGVFCRWAWDIEPIWPIVRMGDATKIKANMHDATMFITNPPWRRDVLHPIILNLSKQAPTWLLFDADWMHTKQAIPFLPLLRKVVAVGRVKWIADSPHTGKDNACWYLFDANGSGPIEFIGRT